MNALRYHIPLIFLFAALVIMARPFVIFSSPSIQAAMIREARVFGLVKAVRKRRERLPIADMVKEEERVVCKLLPLPLLTVAVRKWLRQILSFLAMLFCGLVFCRRRRTVFEVYTPEGYYLALSTLRI